MASEPCGKVYGRIRALARAAMFAFRDKLAPIYAFGILGAVLQIWGGYWDISWHVLGIVETFFTPPHMVLYTGIALGGFAALLGVVLRFGALREDSVRRPLLTGLQIAFAGAVLQGIAGPFDFWWHSTFGFDPFLFTPAHSLLIVGIVLTAAGMAIGSVRLLDARRRGMDLGPLLRSEKTLTRLTILSLGGLWLGLFGLAFLLTNVEGIEYTFGLSDSFSAQTGAAASTVAQAGLAFGATLVLLSTKRIFRWKGSGFAVAAVVAVVLGTANVGFRAAYLLGTAEGAALLGFVPVYYMLLGPIALFDYFVNAPSSRARWLIGAALVAPFAGTLDGWYSAAMWTDPGRWIILNAAFMVVGGLVAGLLSVRFESFLLAKGRGRDVPAA